MSRGLDRAGRLAAERARERAKNQKQPVRLNPDFPYRATPFPVAVIPVTRVGEKRDS